MQLLNVHLWIDRPSKLPGASCTIGSRRRGVWFALHLWTWRRWHWVRSDMTWLDVGPVSIEIYGL